MFSDRLNPVTFAEDEPVAVSVVPTATSPADRDSGLTGAAWIPERVFERILALARAYDLHVLNLLEGPSPPALNATQCSGLQFELEFLCSVVSDPVLHQYSDQISRQALRCRSSVAAQELLFERP